MIIFKTSFIISALFNFTKINKQDKKMKTHILLTKTVKAKRKYYKVKKLFKMKVSFSITFLHVYTPRVFLQFSNCQSVHLEDRGVQNLSLHPPAPVQLLPPDKD